MRYYSVHGADHGDQPKQGAAIMNIKRDMSLDQLAERMWVNGDWPDNWEPIAVVMRDLLNQHAAAYGWEKTQDVEDADWLRLREQAVASSAAAPSWEDEDEACITLGFWAKLVPGQGWVTCEPGDVGARPDINRLRAYRAGVAA